MSSISTSIFILSIDADSNSDVSSISRTSSRATSKRSSYVSKESISQLGSTNQLGVPKRPFSKSASESRWDFVHELFVHQIWYLTFNSGTFLFW